MPAILHYCEIGDLRKAGKRPGERLDSIDVNHCLMPPARQGDYIYVVSIFKGTVLLVARMILDEMTPAGLGPFPLRSPSGDVQFLSHCGTPIHFDRKIPESVVRDIELLGTPVGESPLPQLLAGYVPRGLRVLSLPSAITLDGIIDEE